MALKILSLKKKKEAETIRFNIMQRNYKIYELK